MSDKINIAHENVEKTIRIVDPAAGSSSINVPGMNIQLPGQSSSSGTIKVPLQQPPAPQKAPPAPPVVSKIPSRPPQPATQLPPPLPPQYRPPVPAVSTHVTDNFLEMANAAKLRMPDEYDEEEDYEEDNGYQPPPYQQPPQYQQPQYQQPPPPQPPPYQQPSSGWGEPAAAGGAAIEEFGYLKPREGFKTIEHEKHNIINELYHLGRKGVPVQKFTMNSDIQDMRAEVDRITHAYQMEGSVKFARKMLVACVTGLEFLNKTYDPFKIRLDGWSESVMENVGDYDTIFERLYQKWAGSGQMAPELELLMSLVGSAMMFHLTNTLLKEKLPGIAEAVKSNPGFVQNMMFQAMRQQQPSQPQREIESETSSMIEFDPNEPPAPRSMRRPNLNESFFAYQPRQEFQKPPENTSMGSVHSGDDEDETMSFASGSTNLDDMSEASGFTAGSGGSRGVKRVRVAVSSKNGTASKKKLVLKKK